jgi:hypothetical protein
MIVVTPKIVNTNTDDIGNPMDDRDHVSDMAIPASAIGKRLREVAIMLRCSSWRDFARLCEMDGKNETHMKKIADSGRAETAAWIRIGANSEASLDYILLGRGEIGGRAFFEKVQQAFARAANKRPPRTQLSGSHKVRPAR